MMIVFYSVFQNKYLFTRLCVFLVGMLLTSCSLNREVSLDWPDGDIVFISDREEAGYIFGPLYLLDVSSKQWAAIQGSAPHNTITVAPAWSPSGDKLAFVDILTDQNNVVKGKDDFYGGTGIVFLDSQGERSLFSAWSSAPAWSPDGQYLAFYRGCGNDNNLTLNIAHIDGSDERELVTNLPCIPSNGPIQSVRITWSPDGKFIAYDSPDTYGGWHIWSIPSEGGTSLKVRAGHHPEWSPVSDEIAFDRDGSIWIVSVETGEETEVTTQVRQAEWPTWSPDGQQLAFVSHHDGNAEIYRINRDGLGVERLTNYSGPDLFPVWRHDYPN